MPLCVSVSQGSQAERADQQQRLREIQHSLANHNVQLDIEFSSTLHDREIR